MTNKDPFLLYEISIHKRVNRKSMRWCSGCRAYAIKEGEEYWKCWDDRKGIKTGYHSAFCLCCFEKSEYNDIYINQEWRILNAK